MSDINEALEQLTGSAMCSGAMFFLELATQGRVNLDLPLMDSLGDMPREFLKMRTDLTEPFKPRVLEGDWETVRDALDALPMGAQIRWCTGIDEHPALAIKITNVMGNTHWSATELGNVTSESIARDNTPIKVIA